MSAMELNAPVPGYATILDTYNVVVFAEKKRSMLLQYSITPYRMAAVLLKVLSNST
jgi:hypothetical protein